MQDLLPFGDLFRQPISSYPRGYASTTSTLNSLVNSALGTLTEAAVRRFNRWLSQPPSVNPNHIPVAGSEGFPSTDQIQQFSPFRGRNIEYCSDMPRSSYRNLSTSAWKRQFKRYKSRRSAYKKSGYRTTGGRLSRRPTLHNAIDHHFVETTAGLSTSLVLNWVNSTATNVGGLLPGVSFTSGLGVGSSINQRHGSTIKLRRLAIRGSIVTNSVARPLPIQKCILTLVYDRNPNKTGIPAFATIWNADGSGAIAGESLTNRDNSRRFEIVRRWVFHDPDPAAVTPTSLFPLNSCIFNWETMVDLKGRITKWTGADTNGVDANIEQGALWLYVTADEGTWTYNCQVTYRARLDFDV